MRLRGVDGSNILGFMVALGVLSLLQERAQDEKLSNPRMAFAQDYSPTLTAVHWSNDEIVDVLLGELQRWRQYFNKDLRKIDKPRDFTRDSFEKLARLADKRGAAALAGLACWTGEAIFESTLCAANGAGHQELIRSIRDILALVEKRHLQKALFTSWRRDYEVPRSDRKRLNLGSRKPTLRLDPADERLYALRASDPTPASSAFRTELGAQALAVAAFSGLPVVPRRRPLTVASVREVNRVHFTWYLWSQPATLATVRSLLFSGGDASELRPRGVFAAFRAARVSGDKGKLSFAPSEGLWFLPSNADRVSGDREVQ